MKSVIYVVNLLVFFKNQLRLFLWVSMSKVHACIEFKELFVGSQSAKIFGTNLAKFLAAKGWSQAMLSSKIGADQSSISKWLSGVHLPSGIMIDVLARALGVSISEFFNEESTPPKTEKVTPEEAMLALATSLGYDPRSLKKKNNKDNKK